MVPKLCFNRVAYVLHKHTVHNLPSNQLETSWWTVWSIYLLKRQIFLELVENKRELEGVTPWWGTSCLGFFVLWISCFILKGNSPLVSGHLPFLLCHRSDIIPNPWLFPPVLPSFMWIKSLSSPVCFCVARVFRLSCQIPPALFISLIQVKYYHALFSVLYTSEEEWFWVVIFWLDLLFADSILIALCFPHLERSFTERINNFDPLSDFDLFNLMKGYNIWI